MEEIKISAISEILKSEYGFNQADLEITKIKAGVENSNYLVFDGTKKFVFRIYNDLHSIRGNRDAKSIELEMNFMQMTQENGIESPSIIKTKSGKLFVATKVEDQERFAALFKFLDGEMKISFSSKRAKQVGKVVNSMFDVGKSFSLVEVSQNNNIIDRAFDKFAELSNSDINKNSENYIKLAELENQLKRKYSEIQTMKPLKGFVHGDLKLENLLFSEDDEVSAVLDFDDYRFSFLIEEAVMALMHDLHSKTKNIIRSGNYDSFIGEIRNIGLKREFEGIVFFLKVRYLYDLSKYLIAGNHDLANELWKDKYINKYILI